MKDSRGRSGIPRWIEFVVALIGLVAVSPILLLVGLLIELTSSGSMIFRQTRVGRDGDNFNLYKFRTMRVQTDGVQFTAADDSRMTRIGRFLRKTKMDELPELWNVLTGDMSFVGPRPEVPCYVELSNPLWIETLRARPGITDPVTLKLRNEEELLASIQEDRERYYMETLQPYKLLGYREYIQNRSFEGDVVILCKTLIAVLMPNSIPPPTFAEIRKFVSENLSA
jgi:lipopolysaccharide/colanic/teichoic acid biosynthesis glycosyltransferase